MNGHHTIAVAIALAAVAGCSSDTAKRIAYETVQNVGLGECQKDPSRPCEKREGYDDYQRQRKEIDPR